MPGTLVHSPAQVIKQWLIDEGFGTAPATPPTAHSAWPVFHDNEPASPDSAITITDTQGTTFRKDSFGTRNEHHGVQIKVRGGTHAVGWPKARAIAVALDTLIDPVTVTVDGTDYCVGMIRRTGDVLRLGPEPGSTRRGFTVNAVAYIVTAD